MKIELFTMKGQNLINQIFLAASNETIKTWGIRNDDQGERYLTHSPEQWKDKVLFGFKSTHDKVIIELVWWKTYGEPAKDVKGYCIGRLTEMLLVHFIDEFGKFQIIK